MKKTLISLTTAALLLTGCGEDGGGSSPKSEEYNATTAEISVTTDLITLPSYNIDYKGAILPLEIIADRYSYKDLSEFTLVVTRNIGNVTMDTTFASVLHNVTHDVYIVTADILIPYNPELTRVDHLITVYYMTSEGTKLIHAVNVNQGGLVEPEVHYTYDISVDMTNAVGNYELTQDEETGDVTIVQNPSRLSEDCEDMGWTWHNNTFTCVPPDDSPTYIEVLTCLNNPEAPNKWDFVTGSCYEQLTPDATTEEACGILGALWDSTNEVCYAGQEVLSPSEACTTVSGFWANDQCYAAQEPVSTQEACSTLGALWDSGTQKCYADQQIVTQEEACDIINGAWDERTNDCYAAQEQILKATAEESCEAVNGVWDSINDQCYAAQDTITAEAACNQVYGTWDPATGQCYAAQEVTQAQEACQILNGDWNTSNSTCSTL